MARVFSQKYSSTSIGNGGIHSVGKESVYQIWQFSKIEYLAGISWESLTCKTLMKTSCLHPAPTFRIPVMCRAYASLHGKPTHEIPTKIALVFNSLESSHTLSLSDTTLTNKSHIKYRVHKIEKNYNQIWHGIKANIN